MLHGPDRFTQLDETQRLKGVIAQTKGEVEPVCFDGESASAAEILDECRSMSLMQSFKLVIVDNADELLKVSDDEDGGTAPPAGRARAAHRTARQIFEAYAAAPERAACLILRARVWKPGNFDKAVLANGGAVRKCEEPSDAEACDWVAARAEFHQTTIEPAAVQRLVGTVGTDLGRLDCELAKLAIVHPGQPITERTVAEMTASTREENFWEIQPSLLSGDVPRALAHLSDMLEISRFDPTPLMFTYMELARKLHGVARGRRAGEDHRVLFGRLKLWGSTGQLILDKGAKIDPVKIARLMSKMVDSTVRARTGQGDAARGLEALTIEFASLCRV